MDFKSNFMDLIKDGTSYNKVVHDINLHLTLLYKLHMKRFTMRRIFNEVHGQITADPYFLMIVM
jgi:hypothetical protein